MFKRDNVFYRVRANHYSKVETSYPMLDEYIGDGGLIEFVMTGA